MPPRESLVKRDTAAAAAGDLGAGGELLVKRGKGVGRFGGRERGDTACGTACGIPRGTCPNGGTTETGCDAQAILIGGVPPGLDDAEAVEAEAAEAEAAGLRGRHR